MNSSDALRLKQEVDQSKEKEVSEEEFLKAFQLKGFSLEKAKNVLSVCKILGSSAYVGGLTLTLKSNNTEE